MLVGHYCYFLFLLDLGVSAVSSFFGVLIIATLESGLAQLGASEPVKRVVTGAVIVLAVVVDAWRHHLVGARFAFLTRLLGAKPEPRS